MGGHHRPSSRRARRGRVGSGPEPAVAGPDRAQDRSRQAAGMFTAAGWQVMTLKYGRLLERLFVRPGGPELRQRIDEMTNEEYQRLLRCDGEQLRQRLPGTGPRRARHRRAADRGGRRHSGRRGRQSRRPRPGGAGPGIRGDRRHPPTVIFAYTIKGYGLAIKGHPQNHSALLTDAQMRDLADRTCVDPDDPWRGPAAGSPARAMHRGRPAPAAAGAAPAAAPPLPADMGRTPSGTATTQATLGRTLLDLTRAAPQAARRVVTVSPDVAPSPTWAAG